MAKSLAELLEAAKARVAQLEAKIAQQNIVSSVEPEDDVDFTFGRGDSKRTLTGKVVGIKDDEGNGRWVAIASGEGFDMQTYKVRVGDITANRTADERNKADADPLNAA